MIVRTLDEDLIAHGAGQDFAYIADPSLWAQIPEFQYTLPRYAGSFTRHAWDWLILAGWLLLMAWLALRVARQTEAAR